MVAEFPSYVLARLIGLIRNSGYVDRGKKTPGEGDITGSGEPNCYRSVGKERGQTCRCMGVGFQFLTALPVLSSPFFEITEAAIGGIQLCCNRGHRGGHVVSRFVYIRSQCSGPSGYLLQLSRKKCLANTRIAVNVKKETPPLIINGKPKILLILAHLSLAAYEPSLLPLPDTVLQRTSFLVHQPPNVGQSLHASSFHIQGCTAKR
jgi:hypothetical protein